MEKLNLGETASGLGMQEAAAPKVTVTSKIGAVRDSLDEITCRTWVQLEKNDMYCQGRAATKQISNAERFGRLGTYWSVI